MIALALENKFKHALHHFQIQVSNIQKSGMFYGELLGRLGFAKVFETEGMVEWQKEGTRIIVASLPKGSSLMAIIGNVSVSTTWLSEHEAAQQSTRYIATILFPT